jgi:DmsE family decaheme c-type cytochrome
MQMVSTLSRVRAARAILLATPLLGILAAPPPRPVQDPTAPWPRAGEWLGKELCLDCHEEEGKAIAAGHHAGVIASAALHGCETCHGPGRAHGDDEDNAPEKITHPPKVDARTIDRLCGQCHRDQIDRHRGDMAGFLAARKQCTACHRVHEAIQPELEPGIRLRGRASASRIEPIGAARCVECHPLRDELLQQSEHASLSAAHDATGCESCHGNGERHVASGGLARLITRPDRAADGIETCRSCHAGVDPVRFHWTGDRRRDGHQGRPVEPDRDARDDAASPLLAPGMTCTSCHQVHRAKVEAPAPARRVDPDSGAPLGTPPTNELCASCHAPAMTGFGGSIHASLARRDAPLAIGCGACHAGAEAHARAGGRKDLVDPLRGASAAHQLATCGTCHAGDEHLLHVKAGAHHRNDVGCLSCHTPAAQRARMREAAEQNCATCHRAVEASFRLPNHHPVPEHRMLCSDCHEPHGARSKIRDLELRERRCVQCHPQYRGPFVYAHQASRSDGCVVCHAPHGATNRRLLHQHSPQQNCLQCHADFPLFHDQSAGSVFVDCLNCHTEVHGSNHSRFLFR